MWRKERSEHRARSTSEDKGHCYNKIRLVTIFFFRQSCLSDLQKVNVSVHYVFSYSWECHCVRAATNYLHFIQPIHLLNIFTANQFIFLSISLLDLNNSVKSAHHNFPELFKFLTLAKNNNSPKPKYSIQFSTFNKLLPALTLTETDNRIVFLRLTNQLIGSSLQRHETATDAVAQKADPHLVCLSCCFAISHSFVNKRKKKKNTLNDHPI